MSDYTPEQLRVRADTAEQMLIYVDPRQLRAHAAALETIAKLKEHAEAMAEGLDAWAQIDECKCSEVDTYRRDFTRDEK
jgi:hypothetical protein